MKPIYLVAGAGFFLGMFGYLIVHLWLRPIQRYRRLKRQIREDLKRWPLPQTPPTAESPASSAERMRRSAVALHDAYQYDLPQWYKMVLQNRRELPIEASKAMLKLGKSRGPDPHAVQRLQEIHEMLKLG